MSRLKPQHIAQGFTVREPNGTVGRMHKDSPKSKTEVTRNSRGRSGTHPGRTTDSPRPHRLTFHSHWKHFDSTHTDGPNQGTPGPEDFPKVKSPATRGNTSHWHTQLRLATHERNETISWSGSNSLPQPPIYTRQFQIEESGETAVRDNSGF